MNDYGVECPYCNLDLGNPKGLTKVVLFLTTETGRYMEIDNTDAVAIDYGIQQFDRTSTATYAIGRCRKCEQFLYPYSAHICNKIKGGVMATYDRDVKTTTYNAWSN